MLWESNAIVNYLSAKNPEAGLLPAEPRARALSSNSGNSGILATGTAGAIFVYERVVKPLFGMGEASPSELERGEKMFERIGPVLESQLQKHRFVAGDKLQLRTFPLVLGFRPTIRRSFRSSPIARFSVGMPTSRLSLHGKRPRRCRRPRLLDLTKPPCRPVSNWHVRFGSEATFLTVCAASIASRAPTIVCLRPNTPSCRSRLWRDTSRAKLPLQIFSQLERCAPYPRSITV